MALQSTSQSTLRSRFLPIPENLIAFLVAAGLSEREARQELLEHPELCEYLTNIDTFPFRCRHRQQNRNLRRLLALVLWKKREVYRSCSEIEIFNIFYDANLRGLIKFIISSELSGLERRCDPRSCWKCQRNCHPPLVSMIFGVLEIFVSGLPGEEIVSSIRSTQISDMFLKLNCDEQEWSKPWLDLIAGIEAIPTKFGSASPAPEPIGSGSSQLILPTPLDQVTKDLVTMVLLALEDRERRVAWELSRPTIHRTVYGTRSIEEKTSDIVLYLRGAESDNLRFFCFCFLLGSASPEQAVEYARCADGCNSSGSSFKTMSQAVFDQTEVGIKANRARGGYNIWSVASERIKKVHGMSLTEIAEAIRQADRASTPETRKELWSRVDIGNIQRDISIGLEHKMLPILVVIALVRYFSDYGQRRLL